MKFFAASAALLASVAGAIPEISSDSALGQNLLAHARRLDNGDYSDTWVSGYSVKFQGCLNIKQWNDNADAEEDVRISTTSLVRFRLCPTGSCSATKTAGCTAGYGDYVVETSTFLKAYYEAHTQAIEYACYSFLTASCNCAESDDKADDFNVDYCKYDCFNNAKMFQCIDQNPYDDNAQQQDAFAVEDYLACAEFKGNNNRRRLADQNNAEAVKYYVGHYCANQGGAIYLGLFTDDTCTEAASGISFSELAGYALPYAATSIVDSTCLSCLEPADQDAEDANDQADGDAVLDQCETLYTTAGKCETYLPAETSLTPNNAACNYIEGIKIVRQDGIITSAKSRPSAVATAFIVISAMAFAAMAFYVWYLRTRLGIKKETLL